MPPLSLTLPVELTLHLTATVCHTTSALSDPPKPEVDTCSIDGVSLIVREEVEGLDGVKGYVPRPIDLTKGLGASSGNLAMFLNRLLDALGDEVDDAVLEVG